MLPPGVHFRGGQLGSASSSIGYLPPVEHEDLYLVTTVFPTGEGV